MSPRTSADRDHPSNSALLLATEGELPAAELARVREHLRGCDSCQAFVQDVAGTVSVYHDQMRVADATDTGVPPASSTKAFQIRLQETARESREAQSRMPGRTWLRVAAVVPLVIGALVFSSLAPTLKANELLARAADAESRVSLAPETSGVVIRMTGRATWTVTRRARELRAVSGSASVEPAMAAFARVGLDWNAPLSVATFRTWREGLASKQDRVAQARSEITIETQTDEGLVREAMMRLDGVTLRAMRVEWRLATGERLEIEALDNLPPVSIAAARTASNLAPAGRSSGAPMAHAAAIDEALDHEEVEARAVLHRADADIAHDIAITRTADHHLSITGVVDSATAKAQLTESFAPLTHTRVRLASADELTVADLPTTSPSMVLQHEARPALLTAWLEKRFPSAAAQQAFGATALTNAREINARALAWHRLTERYPARELARLNSRDRDTILELIRSHTARLSAALAALEQHLAPVFEDMTATAVMTRTTATVDTPASFEVRARRIEQTMFDLFADVHANRADGAGDVSRLLMTLHEDLQEGQRGLTASSAHD